MKEFKFSALLGSFFLATNAMAVTPDSGDMGNIHWDLAENGTLTISKKDGATSGDMPNFNYGGSGAPWNRDDVSDVVILSGVTSIGNWAGGTFGTINSISIPNTVSKLGNYAFTHMTTNKLELPNSIKELGDWTFHANYITKAIVIPESVETLNVTSSNGATYCPMALRDKCSDQYLYENIGGEYIVYNSDGTIKESFKDYSDFSKGKVLAKYTKNVDGSYTLRDAENNFIGFKGKRIYTIQEANQVSAPTGNRVSIRYK